MLVLQRAFQARLRGFDSRPRHLKFGQVVKRQTRDAQNVVPFAACEFDSRLGYFFADELGLGRLS